jgi:hypothetical protein
LRWLSATMTLSVAGSNSTAVEKQKRHCGSRLFTLRRALAMSGLASTVCAPHFDNTWASSSISFWELAQNDFRVREVREYNRKASVIDDRG